MNDLIEEQNFNERMKNRIRESIGELLTDDELSEIVKRSMEEIFFKPSHIKEGYHTKTLPPFVQTLLKELLKDKVYREVSLYLTDNKDMIAKIIQEVISKGMGKALVEALTLQFQSELMNFQNNLMQNIQDR
jgi:predicted house-cleaning noncanonical NTP pyrophosphatase (MazG superfamily)